jgi:hypothetical protein
VKVARIHSFGPPDVVVVLPLSEARRAQAMLAGAPHKSGKILLEIGHPQQHRSAQQSGSTPTNPVHPTVD